MFLGIELDSVAQIARLPPHKFAATIDLGIVGETVVYPEVVGIAYWFLPARLQDYPPGPSFVRGMINLLSLFRSTAYPIRLNFEFLCDFVWWREFLTTWDGVSFFRMPSISSLEDLFVATDAGGSVCFGAIWGAAWFATARVWGHRWHRLKV